MNTLTQIKALGYALAATCQSQGCGRIQDFSADELIARYGGSVTLPEINERLKCARCGGSGKISLVSPKDMTGS